MALYYEKHMPLCRMTLRELIEAECDVRFLAHKLRNNAHYSHCEEHPAEYNYALLNQGYAEDYLAQVHRVINARLGVEET